MFFFFFFFFFFFDLGTLDSGERSLSLGYLFLIDVKLTCSCSVIISNIPVEFPSEEKWGNNFLLVLNCLKYKDSLTALNILNEN